MINSVARGVLGGVALILISSTPLLGHPTNGVLHLASEQIPIGGELVLRGEKFERGTDMKLELRGTLDSYPIGEVKTDAAGTFEATITLPPHVPTGAYTLVAIAPDGDITARAELAITPAPAARTPGASTPSMAQMPGMEQEMPGQHATDEMMAIDQHKSTAQRIIVAMVIVLSLAGGAMLLSKSTIATGTEWMHDQAGDLPDGAGHVRGEEDDGFE